jgi:hypothetical protein
VSTAGSYSGAFNHVYASDQGIFQTAGAGAHYLAQGTREKGTPNLHQVFFDEMKSRTTVPPIVVTDDFANTSVVWRPVVERNGSNPDIGYAYPAVDYLIKEVDVTNGSLVLTNGVVVASCGDYGIQLLDGGHLHSTGTPLKPNRIVRHYAIQENRVNPLSGSFAGYHMTFAAYAPTSPATIKHRFTEVAT